MECPVGLTRTIGAVGVQRACRNGASACYGLHAIRKQEPVDALRWWPPEPIWAAKVGLVPSFAIGLVR